MEQLSLLNHGISLSKKDLSVFDDEDDKIEMKQKYERNIQTIYRARRKIKRLIFANANQHKEEDKFIMLTFKEFKTRDEVIYCFKRFNERLRYNYPDYDYKYIAVIEQGIQGKKQLRLHCLFFDLPFINIRRFEKLWKYGNVDMKSIDNYIDNYYNISNYFLKYVKKTERDESFFSKGADLYLTSRGLKKIAYF